jgi:HlyD family secretion protein
MDVQRTDVSKRKRARRMVQVAIAATAVVGIAVSLAKLEPMSASAERATLLIDTVRQGEFVRQVRGPGVLAPREMRWVAAQAPGRVDQLLLKPGALVQPDSVIAILSNPELERLVQEAEWEEAQGSAELAALKLTLRGQVLDQKARVAEARTNSEALRVQEIAELQAAAAVSQLQLRRTQLLNQQNAILLQIEEERLANLENSTAEQLRAQNARLAQLRNIVARQKQQLASLRVTAGLKGVLQTMPVQIGQQLTAGTLIARVARPDDLVAQLKIPELQANDITPGLKAVIDTRAGLVKGTVSRVDPVVAEGSVVVDIDLADALPTGARPDLSVDGTIEIERKSNALFVGRPASGGSDSSTTVLKLDASGGRAHRVPVRFGKESVNQIAILSGLQPGDQIIVSETSQWSSYDEIHIR